MLYRSISFLDLFECQWMISKVQVKRLSIIKSIYFHFALPVDSSGMAGVQTRGGTRAKAVAKAGGRIRGRT